MCDQTKIEYLDGELVWVKLGSCWWPGEVVGFDKLPPDVLPSFRKPPIAVVKFFQEDSFEYVKNIANIYKYNCSRKNEFIKKGLEKSKSNLSNMEKFSEDVIHAEEVTNGDVEILTREEFQEKKKENYSALFGDPKKTPTSARKGRPPLKSSPGSPNKTATPSRKFSKGNPDYKVHILVQSKPEPAAPSTPSTSRAGSEVGEDKSNSPIKICIPSTPTTPSGGVYSCHACSFHTNRLNVMILHNKSHSSTFTAYTPSPARKKPVAKTKSPTKTTTSPKTTKPRKPRDDKQVKERSDSKVKKPTAKKRASEPNKVEAKKKKTDDEIKTSLLADWDDGEDDSNDASKADAGPSSPEIPVAAESPALPSSDEISSAKVPDEGLKKPEEPTSSDKSDTKYDFCEDEEWPIEAGGRKIPRIKSSKRKEDAKSLDDEDMAKEVAELLNSTTVPNLPVAPEPLRVEENFPERSVAKSPDKATEKAVDVGESGNKKESKIGKTIFKTKTFFRSRHSRSQDAIGKYVAEQLNAAERMDTSGCDLNGSEVISSPDARDSPPPIENVKVAKLAPKIQLKKMKADAEAAQLREKEKNASKLLNNVDKITYDIKENNMEIICKPETLTVALPEIKDVPEIPTLSKIEESSITSRAPEEMDNKDTFTDDVVLNVDVPVPQNVTLQPETTPELTVHVDQFLNSDEPLQEPIVKEKDLSFMSESTASAVDALLSVSRENDRVTKTVSKDLPEDLFEEDNKTETNNEDNVVSNVSQGSNGALLGIEDKEIKSKEASFRSQNFMDNDLSKLSMDYTPDVHNDVSTTQCIESTVSDLQVAEALMNLPATSMKNKSALRRSFDKTYNKDLKPGYSILKSSSKIDSAKTSKSETIEKMNSEPRFETEEEKDKNLNAAQSLVQMSEAVERKVKPVKEIVLNNSLTLGSQVITIKKNDVQTPRKLSLDDITAATQNNQFEATNGNAIKDATTSKLLKMLEAEPSAPKSIPQKVTPIKVITTVTQGKEKILNFDVSKSPLKPSSTPKQKIIIRRTTPSKNLINNLNDASKSETLVLSRTNEPLKDSAVKTYTIQATPEVSTDPNTIIIQQKPRQVANVPKITKIKPKPTFVAVTSELKPAPTAEDIFDINSMPVVLSEDIVTPDNIDTMPIVMSDGNLITNAVPAVSAPLLSTPAPVTPVKPHIKTNVIPLHPTSVTASTKVVPKPKIIKQIVTHDKIAINSSRSEPKTLLVGPLSEVISKSTTPNILSKSSKLRGGKPMLVIDKTTGKQKIIMAKAETAPKEIKPVPAKIQNVSQITAGRSEGKFIILPTANSPKPRTMQQMVIDKHTGKAHMLVAKPAETVISIPESKPVSAKLIPAAPNQSPPGGTVMIITNAQGTQSRIVLTPEHEKILFPNKQPAQIKAPPQRISPVPTPSPKPQTIVTAVSQAPTKVPAKTPTKIIAKPKSNAIITSKGQLIMSGRVTTTTAGNIAPMPEVRPTITKRIVTSEPKKIMPKPSSEPLIFLQHKSGAVMQLTTAQFEHLQRTGQLLQKTTPPAPQPAPSQENKIVIQKSITINSQESLLSAIQKPQKSRASKSSLHSPTPPKRAKKEIVIKSVASSPVPTLTPIQKPPPLPQVITAVPTPNTSSYSDLDNIEELLPSTAIARLPESMLVAGEQVIETPSQSEIVAVPEPLLQEETIIQQDVSMDQELVAQQEAIAQQESLMQQEALAQQELLAQQQLQQEATQQGEIAAPIADSHLLAIPGENFGGPSGTFYLCVEDNGILTPIDNRPLVLENNQLVPLAIEPVVQQPERRDILEAALANSDVFQAEPVLDEAPDFRDLNANVSVHCRVSETSTTLNQPIMTPLEVPSKGDAEPSVPANLEDGLAVIGVTPNTVPTSLELPITVTDPRIAPKTTDPLTNASYSTILTSGSDATCVSTEEVTTSHPPGPISMPILTEDDCVGKSMPILTDDVNERIASSVESNIDSPSSVDVRESETDYQAHWPSRVLTSGSDSSEGSAEIPLQPAIQISVDDITQTS